MKYKLEKKFSCAHFYHQPAWSKDKNQEEFGKCFTEFGHGHDYLLEIEFQSENPASFHQVVDRLIQSLDHQHLNFVIPEFKTKIPTTENLALYIQEKLKAQLQQLDSTRLQSLKLKETEDIWVELSSRS